MTFAILKTAVGPEFKILTIKLAAKKYNLSTAVVRNLYLKCLYKVVSEMVRTITKRAYQVAISKLSVYDYKGIRDALQLQCKKATTLETSPVEKKVLAPDPRPRVYRPTEPAIPLVGPNAIPIPPPIVILTDSPSGYHPSPKPRPVIVVKPKEKPKNVNYVTLKPKPVKVEPFRLDRKLLSEEAYLLGTVHVMLKNFPDSHLVVQDNEISFTIDNKRESVKVNKSFMGAGSYIGNKIKQSKLNLSSSVVYETVVDARRGFMQMKFNQAITKLPELAPILALFLETAQDYIDDKKGQRFTVNTGDTFPVGSRIAVRSSGKYIVGTVTRRLPKQVQVKFDDGSKDNIEDFSSLVVLPASAEKTLNPLTEKGLATLANLSKLKG